MNKGILHSQVEKEETVRMIQEELKARAEWLPDPTPWQVRAIEKAFQGLQWSVRTENWRE